MRLDAYFSQPLSDVFDRNGQETEGLDLGTLDVTSGRRAVGDNTFFPQDQLEMDSQPGRYSVQANIRDWGTDRRGSRLRAAAKSKNTYLAAFYHRVAARRGKKRAVVAVAHKLLRIAYHVIQHNCPYHELQRNRLKMSRKYDYYIGSIRRRAVFAIRSIYSDSAL
jgi:hypothetical protein